jgi:hypothetical protein
MELELKMPNAWKKLVSTYRDGNSDCIPLGIRADIVEYFTEGKIDTQSLLYGMLICDTLLVFQCKKSPLESSRMQTVWDFLTDFAPSSAWGSPNNVQQYRATMRNLPIARKNYEESLTKN